MHRPTDGRFCAQRHLVHNKMGISGIQTPFQHSRFQLKPMANMNKKSRCDHKYSARLPLYAFNQQVVSTAFPHHAKLRAPIHKAKPFMGNARMHVWGLIPGPPALKADLSQTCLFIPLLCCRHMRHLHANFHTPGVLTEENMVIYILVTVTIQFMSSPHAVCTKDIMATWLNLVKDKVEPQIFSRCPNMIMKICVSCCLTVMAADLVKPWQKTFLAW